MKEGHCDSNTAGKEPAATAFGIRFVVKGIECLGRGVGGGGVSCHCCLVVSLTGVTSEATLRHFRVHYDFLPDVRPVTSEMYRVYQNDCNGF